MQCARMLAAFHYQVEGTLKTSWLLSVAVGWGSVSLRAVGCCVSLCLRQSDPRGWEKIIPVETDTKLRCADRNLGVAP